MSDNKKIFTIKINGIKQAYNEVCLLTDALNDLEVSLTRSNTITLLSNIFDSANNVSSAFKTSTIDLEKIISESTKLETVVKQIETMHTQVTQPQNTLPVYLPCTNITNFFSPPIKPYII